MYLRNVVMLTLWVGAWHLPLYALKRQGIRFKYNKRWMATNSRGFLFGSQLWDNVFWSLVPGAGIWTIYEALLLWAYAEGWLVVTLLPRVAGVVRRCRCTRWSTCCIRPAG